MHALGLIIRGGFKPWPCNLHGVMGLSWVCHGLGKPEVFRKTPNFADNHRLSWVCHGMITGLSRVC